MECDRALLQVPLETLRTHLKDTRQTIERQLTSILAEVRLQAAMDPQEAAKLAERVVSLRQQLTDLKAKYAQISKLISVRTQFVVEQSRAMSTESPTQAKVAAMDSLLQLRIVEHYLEHGDIELAHVLCPQELEPMLDWQIHERRSLIGRALKVDRNPEPCIAWCKESTSFFKKSRLGLELDCQLVHLKEIAARGDIVAAVSHARKIAEGCADVDFNAARLLKSTTSVVAAMQASSRTGIDQSEWDELAAKFYYAYDQRFNRESQVSLVERISAGLFALQTQECRERQATRAYYHSECPSCSVELGPLARRLPVPHHSHSILDPDCVLLANGRIVGLERAKAAAGARGTVADPITGEVFESYQKVYPL